MQGSTVLYMSEYVAPDMSIFSRVMMAGGD